MKFPSLTFLGQQAYRALAKYPMTILSAAVAVFFGIYLVEIEDRSVNAFPYINLLLCGYLGVPLFVAVKTCSVAMSSQAQWLWAGRAVIILLLIAVYFYLPGSEETLNKSIPYIRYAIFATAAHLLVSFAPFLKQGTLNGFWNFNKAIFLRFLLSALYSAFFYVGIALALLAIKSLFDVDIKEQRFLEIFIFIAGVFNTWFFTAGIPEKFVSLDEDHDYPRGLRIFILYVLIPMLALYFVILYSYSAKIIFIWDWPRGIITYMIIAVAVLGILAMLLAWPWSETESKSPLSFLSRGYYWVLFPMIIMLYLAIGIRVNDYGMTINRYLTVLLGIWLTFVSVYLIVIGKNIKLIPMSLFLFILLTSFGPWGIFKVSERSQVSRLKAVLEGAGILQNGKIKNEPRWVESDTSSLVFEEENPNEGLLSDSLHNEVMSIVNYLRELHGFNGIADWYAQDLKAIARARNVNEGAVAMQLMGLEYQYKYVQDNDYRQFYPEARSEGLYVVKGYDYLIQVDHYRYNKAVPQLAEKDQLPGIELLPVDSLFIIKNKLLADSLVMNIHQKLGELIAENADSYTEVSKEKLSIQAENEWIRAKLQLTNLAASGGRLDSYSGKLLVRLSELDRP